MSEMCKSESLMFQEVRNRLDYLERLQVELLTFLLGTKRTFLSGVEHFKLLLAGGWT